MRLSSFLPVLRSTFYNARFLDATVGAAIDDYPFLDTDIARGTVLLSVEDFLFFLIESELVDASVAGGRVTRKVDALRNLHRQPHHRRHSDSVSGSDSRTGNSSGRGDAAGAGAGIGRATLHEHTRDGATDAASAGVCAGQDLQAAWGITPFTRFVSLDLLEVGGDHLDRLLALDAWTLNSLNTTDNNHETSNGSTMPLWSKYPAFAAHCACIAAGDSAAAGDCANAESAATAAMLSSLQSPTLRAALTRSRALIAGTAQLMYFCNATTLFARTAAAPTASAAAGSNDGLTTVGVVSRPHELVRLLLRLDFMTSLPAPPDADMAFGHSAPAASSETAASTAAAAAAAANGSASGGSGRPVRVLLSRIDQLESSPALAAPAPAVSSDGDIAAAVAAAVHRTVAAAAAAVRNHFAAATDLIGADNATASSSPNKPAEGAVTALDVHASAVALLRHCLTLQSSCETNTASLMKSKFNSCAVETGVTATAAAALVAALGLVSREHCSPSSAATCASDGPLSKCSLDGGVALLLTALHAAATAELAATASTVAAGTPDTNQFTSSASGSDGPVLQSPQKQQSLSVTVAIARHLRPLRPGSLAHRSFHDDDAGGYYASRPRKARALGRSTAAHSHSVESGEDEETTAGVPQLELNVDGVLETLRGLISSAAHVVAPQHAASASNVEQLSGAHSHENSSAAMAALALLPPAFVTTATQQQQPGVATAGSAVSSAHGSILGASGAYVDRVLPPGLLSAAASAAYDAMRDVRSRIKSKRESKGEAQAPSKEQSKSVELGMFVSRSDMLHVLVESDSCHGHSHGHCHDDHDSDDSDCDACDHDHSCGSASGSEQTDATAHHSHNSGAHSHSAAAHSHPSLAMTLPPYSLYAAADAALLALAAGGLALAHAVDGSANTRVRVTLQRGGGTGNGSQQQLVWTPFATPMNDDNSASCLAPSLMWSLATLARWLPAATPAQLHANRDASDASNALTLAALCDSIRSLLPAAPRAESAPATAAPWLAAFAEAWAAHCAAPGVRTWYHPAARAAAWGAAAAGDGHCHWRTQQQQSGTLAGAGLGVGVLRDGTICVVNEAGNPLSHNANNAVHTACGSNTKPGPAAPEVDAATETAPDTATASSILPPAVSLGKPRRARRAPRSDSTASQPQSQSQMMPLLPARALWLPLLNPASAAAARAALRARLDAAAAKLGAALGQRESGSGPSTIVKRAGGDESDLAEMWKLVMLIAEESVLFDVYLTQARAVSQSEQLSDAASDVSMDPVAVTLDLTCAEASQETVLRRLRSLGATATDLSDAATVSATAVTADAQKSNCLIGAANDWKKLPNAIEIMSWHIDVKILI